MTVIVIEVEIDNGRARIAVKAHLPASEVRVPRSRLATVRRFRNVETIAKAWNIAKLKRRGIA
ncbi:hypothetical protein [Burkholderia sp. S171]|uniref:hypothetical protein n=1 Tax=Burkholderia sp. S171 TaxID=1641860 RepID=UPI00131EC25A|nr:hypothetical protein [Burkholderia sp. S171]